MAPRCPECGSERVWKDGTRQTKQGRQQRYLCRDCGYRFTYPRQKPLIEHAAIHVNTGFSPVYALKEVEEESRKAGTRETTTKVDEATLRGKLVEYLWYLKKEGYAPSTIETRRRVLKRMLKRGVNILDPEAVKEYFAKQEWKDSTRNIAIETYTSFLRAFDRSWKPPITRKTRQLPFIPTEREIDQLIAS